MEIVNVCINGIQLCVLLWMAIKVDWMYFLLDSGVRSNIKHVSTIEELLKDVKKIDKYINDETLTLEELSSNINSITKTYIGE